MEKYIEKYLKLSNKEAKSIVNEYVSFLKSELKLNKTVEIKGVGVFKVLENNSLRFTSYSEENYLVDSFGLDSVEEVEKSTVFEETHKPKISVIDVQSRNSTLPFILVGIIVIGILLALTVFLSSKFDLYLFNVGNSKNNEKIVIARQVKEDPDKKIINNELTDGTDIKNALFYSEETAKSPNQNTTTQYHLIIGSYKSYKYANDLKAKLIKEGFNPEIVDQGGNYRVSIGNFSDKNDALKELHRLRQQVNRSLWLLSINN